MKKGFYIFTISSVKKIVDEFQQKEKSWYYPDCYFLGSKFNNKEDALNFASKIEAMKFANDETKFIIKATHDRGYFVGLFN